MSLRLVNFSLRSSLPLRNQVRMMTMGGDGSGAGKGGGSGGSIRDAGGSFGKREAAQEEHYFRKQQSEQIEKLKSTIDKQITQQEEMIRKHEEAIAEAKKTITELKKSKN